MMNLTTVLAPYGSVWIKRSKNVAAYNSCKTDLKEGEM